MSELNLSGIFRIINQIINHLHIPNFPLIDIWQLTPKRLCHMQNTKGTAFVSGGQSGSSMSESRWLSWRSGWWLCWRTESENRTREGRWTEEDPQDTRRAALKITLQTNKTFLHFSCIFVLDKLLNV